MSSVREALQALVDGYRAGYVEARRGLWQNAVNALEDAEGTCPACGAPITDELDRSA